VPAKKTSNDTTSPPPVQILHPNAVYGLESARLALGLTRTTLRREIRLGRLRVSKRGGRYFLLGEWLLEWLRAGELRRASRVNGELTN
jgi:hypothetical protein